MKGFGFLFAVGILLVGCVPAKKYNDLLEKEKLCSSELEKYKTSALNFEASASNFKTKFEILEKDVKQLKADTSKMGEEYRTLHARYYKLASINEALETNFNKLRLVGAEEYSRLTSELEAKQIELQKREDELIDLEKELTAREQKLIAQESRLAELNQIIREKEEATKLLKEKVSNALKNFENKGLTVIEKDGKIYVSMEAKLLFQSGSIDVEAEGEEALIQLAKVLETEKELEIIVEGHTDTDKMSSSKHPNNNWELSVLRSTSVISIMANNSNIDPVQLMAAGRSEYHPVDAVDKAKNRRIEIIISPDLDALYNLIAD